MANTCVVCYGTGHLLKNVCPLCDGDPSFGQEVQQRYVFILAGQSNMVGRGTGAELDQALLDFVQAHADVYMAYDIDKSAKEQENTTSSNQFLRLSRETQWSDGGKCFTHGPEWGIAQRVVERFILPGQQQQHVPQEQCAEVTKPRLYFIKFAMGSTNLHEDWRPDGLYYGSFISFVQAMLQRVAELEASVTKLPLENVSSNMRVDCMFWNQGDSDASGKAVMRDNYQTNLVKFVQRIWGDLTRAGGPTDFPFVPLQLHWKIDESSKSNKKYRRSMDRVNEAMHCACQKLGSTACMAKISPDMEALLASMCHEDGHSGTSALVLEGQHLVDTFCTILHKAES